jgi:uncharacterized protein YbjT (DUF2867 family)
VTNPTIAVAGAGGFVGTALIADLAADHPVIALGRSARAARGNLTWRACDLFNLRATEAALVGADVAVYLVHSMAASARLTQGAFGDLELLCADNFARAAAAAGVGHIVYVGGLQPPGEAERSRHLRSRRDVETILGGHGVPVTTLRAGMIVGAGGSSFQILTRLVRRLPIMVAPRWVRARTQAIALGDVVAALRYAVHHPALAGEAYDLGGPDVLTYGGTLELTAELLGKRARVYTLPVRTLRLSLWWVRLITGLPMALIRPLVESLEHDLVASDGLRLQRLAGIEAMPLRTALARALLDTATAPPPPPRPPAARAQVSTVLSVQRMALPAGRDASWAAAEYARFLPRFMRPLVRVVVDASGTMRFHVAGVRRPLLELTLAGDRSRPDRQLYDLTGGLLVAPAPGLRPRLEFRVVGDQLMVAIQDFVPRLPWPVYVATQAVAHLWVMRGFAAHLRTLAT